MAKIYNEKKSFNWDKPIYLMLCVLAVLVFLWAAGNAYMGLTTGNGVKIVCSVVLIIVCRIVFDYSKNAFNRERVINHSYELTNRTLSGLPDEYSVYSNIHIGEAEFDHIVVGDNGIFVVINRSVKGTVYCNPNSSSWDIHKIGRGGTGYSSGMKNPLKILKWQIFTLADYLKKNGINIWVDGCVYFSTADTDLRDATDKVFDSQSDFTRFILDYEPKKYVEPSLISKAKKLLGNVD